ncbi:MAG TPA: DUF1302 family protein [Candidatus Binatia bacterium]|nr:DUF1302 family protein [Candidatus Binatia bacterium]
MHHRHRFNHLVAAVLFQLFVAATVSALPRYGPLEVAGNLSAQNEIRNSDIDHLSLVQQRNTFKLRVDYDMLDRGRLIERFDIPFIEKTKLFLLYRGVYDSVYDLKPGFEQTDIYGRKINDPVYAKFPPFPGFSKFYPENNLDTLKGAEGLRFENQLREAYFDVKLKTLPLSFRLGRQQIVWGETDNFRMLDRVNALNLTWHLQQESWDELRIPYWMIKGLWTIDQLGPLSSAFVEAYWNPGDWSPAKRAFLPRPWSAPILNPLNSAMGLTGIHRLYHDTKLSLQGDYSRDPGDNSQVGVRFSAVSPQGVQFTLNYFYQRWAGDDGTNAASIAGITGKAEGNSAIVNGQLPIVVVAPYIHTIGVSLNYADEEYTQAVFRAETIYEMGVPFNDYSKPLLCDRPQCTPLKGDVFGISKHDMWKGMLAFDRPTWIRPLNRKSTFLILGQFFWHYLLDNPELNPSTHQGLRGEFSSSSYGVPPFTAKPIYDRVRDWEVLTTLAATTFYQGGKIVPLVVYILDPVNKYNMEVTWMVDYFLTNNLILNLSQRYFINTTSAPVYESWGLGGINRGRSETGLRLTYQF